MDCKPNLDSVPEGYLLDSVFLSVCSVQLYIPRYSLLLWFTVVCGQMTTWVLEEETNLLA